MQSSAARKRGFEFAGERRIGVFEKNFRIAAGKHRGDIAGAGRNQFPGRRILVRLNRNRRRCKADAAQCAACGFGVAHEMRDMIKKYLLAGRQLAASLRRWCAAGQKSHSEWAMPASSTTLPQRTISDCRNSWSSAGEPAPTGIIPISRMRKRTSGIATAAFSAALSLPTIAGGVRAGAITP